MALTEVSAKIPAKDGKPEKSATINYDFGENLAKAVEMFGEDVVFSNAVANMKVRLQAVMRSHLENNKVVEDLVTGWKPGQVTTGGKIDPVSAVKDAFAGMSPEDKKAFLAQLKSMA